MNESIDINPIKEEDAVERSWAKIEEDMEGTAYEAQGMRIVSGIGKKQKSAPWFRKEV